MRQLQLRIQELDTQPVRLRNRSRVHHGRIVSPLTNSGSNTRVTRSTTHSLRHVALYIIVGLLFISLTPTLAHAQGCAQCLDTTRATPPAVQAAYRHAILLMVGAASTLFIAGVILIRREP